jgi:hypothetical protein
MRMRIAMGAPAGEYGLALGVLRPDNQTTVPMSTRPQTVSTWQEDSVLVGTILVASAG